MSHVTPPPRGLEDAVAALRSGDAPAARKILEPLAGADPGDARVLLTLGAACQEMADFAAAHRAVDQVLRTHPSDFAALLLKADIFRAEGDVQQAGRYYNAAILVAPPPERQTPAIRAQIERAKNAGRDIVADYETHLRNSLAARGYDAAPNRPGSVSESLDILFGRRKIYLQEPEQFYFPGLPQRQFYERSEFAWVSAVEAQTAAIAAEARALLNENGVFRPYQHSDVSGPRLRTSPLLDKPDWSAAFLIRGGVVNDAVAAHCPATMAALDMIPLCDVPGKNPSVLFSLLRPGVRIDPHHGLVNYRLIAHLPLIVPEGCSLRVGNERRFWDEGKLLIFDDSIEHEAENPSDRLRVVLLFDIWRPELSGSDRKFIRALFETIDSYRRPTA